MNARTVQTQSIHLLFFVEIGFGSTEISSNSQEKSLRQMSYSTPSSVRQTSPDICPIDLSAVCGLGEAVANGVIADIPCHLDGQSVA
jgi:hypothetical protein